MLLKITPNEIILEDTQIYKIRYAHNHSEETPLRDSHFQTLKTIAQFIYFTVLVSVKCLCNSKIFALNTVFIIGNKRNRRSRRVESQSSDRDENTSETSFTQGNATLVDVSENVNNIFDRNLRSELTEPSQISNEIEAITRRLSE